MHFPVAIIRILRHLVFVANTLKIPLMNTPGKDFYLAVRAGLIRKGTNLNAWCANNHILRPTADKALLGLRNGPKARALRLRLATQTGVTLSETETK